MQQRREPATPLRLNFGSPTFSMMVSLSAPATQSPTAHFSLPDTPHPPAPSLRLGRKTRVPGLLGGHAIHHPFRPRARVRQKPIQPTTTELWTIRACLHILTRQTCSRSLTVYLVLHLRRAAIFGQFWGPRAVRSDASAFFVREELRVLTESAKQARIFHLLPGGPSIKS